MNKWKVFKKGLGVLVLLSAFTIAGCGKSNEKINVVSREDGSGTRGAFTELLGIMQDEKDNTISSAEITNSTSVMLSTVEGNKNSIGYVSLGSLSDKVKALKIDDVEATQENVKNGTYPVSRPFNLVMKGDLSEIGQDFVKFVLSDAGQKVVEEEKYISLGGSEYKSSNLKGKITIAGSTSVAPLIEILAEEYKALNKDVTIEVQQTGSSAGILSTIEGACEIGMASRELKSSEIEQGVAPIPIALDGIAVIVNKDNKLDSISTENVMKIYTGEITDWTNVK